MKQILTAIILLCSLTLRASETPSFPFVAATGTAEREVKPDKATIRFTVLTFDASSEVAVNKLDQCILKTLKILKDFSIPKEAIEAKDIRKNVVKNRKDYQEVSILGYNISREFTVELKQLDEYAQLLDALAKTDGVQSINTSFDVTTRESVNLQLITEACEKAKIEGEQLALGLGMKLGKPFAVKQGSTSATWAIFNFDRVFSQYYQENSFSSFASRSHDQIPDMYFIPDTIKLSSNVNVIYRLE